MVPPIASQEILPGRAPEPEPKLREVEERLLALKNRKEGKNQTLEQSKSELDAIRGSIDALAEEEGIDTEQLTALRTSLEDIAVELEKEAVPEVEVVEEAVAAEPKSVVETWYKPQTWTPETKKKAEAAGWGLGIGLGLVGIALAWRAMKKKTGEAVKATGEKVGWFWGKVKWAVGLTVATGLGYIGYRVFQDYRKIDGLKTQLESLVKALPTLKDEKLLEAQQRIQDLQREIQDIKNGVTPKQNNVNTTAEENRRKAEEIAETARENARKMAENPALQESQENAKRYAYVKGMLLFEPAQSAWTVSENTKHSQLTDTIHENEELPIEEILSARTPPFTIKEGAGDLPSRHQASLYLWKFCKNHRNIAEKYKPKDGDKPMTLAMFLGKVAQTYAAAADIDKTIRAAGGNVFAAIQNFDTTEVITSDVMGEAAKEYIEESMADTGLSEEEIQQLDWAQLFAIFTSTTGSIAGSTRIDEGTPVSRVLMKLHEKLKDKDQTDVDEYMLPFFHQILPRANWDSANNQNNLDRVHEYLVEKMPMHQALRCAFYANLIKKGNPTGIVLMQAEILKYVAHEEESPLFSMDKQFVISRIGETMIDLSTGKISDEWKALNIDPKMLEKGLGVLQGALVKGAETGAIAVVGVVLEGGKQVLAPIIDHPKASVGFTAAAVVGTAAVLQYRSDTHRLIAALDASTKRVRLQNVYRSTDLLTKRLATHEAMKKIVELVADNSDIAKRTAAMKALDKFTKGTRSMESLINLSKELTKILPYTPDLGKALDTLKLHQKTLRNFRLPIRAASLAKRIPMGLAKPLKFLGKGVPIAAAIIEGGAYEMFEREALQKQLDAETDPLKRKIIYNDMLSKRGNWMTSAASSPFMFTPIGATVFFGNMARQHANDSINAGTREMLEDRRDWKDKTPGELLHKVQKAAPGTTLTYGHWLAKNPMTDTEAFDGANASIRSEAYATYCKQNAFLPPVSADMLTEEEAMDPAVSQRRLTILQEDQTNYFTQSALSYLSHVTDRTFVSVDAEILHRALVYAYRCSVDWQLMMLGQETTFTKKDWAEKETAITDIITEENKGLVATANEEIKNGERAQDVLPFFFMESLKDNLAMCEANILNTDYSNWSYWNFNPFGASTHDKMQQAARTVFAEKITATLEKICDKAGPLTKESFASGREALISVLKSDPNTLAQEGLNRSDSAGIIELGADPALLSVDGMLVYMQTYSEAIDRTLAA